MALPSWDSGSFSIWIKARRVQSGDSLAGMMPRGVGLRLQRLRFLALALTAVLIGTFPQKLEAQLPQLPLQQPGPTRSGQPTPLPPGNPQQPAQLTPEDVTAFLDGFLPLQLQRDDIAGVTIGISMDGKPLIMKGYGYANWKTKASIDPEKTTFRLASISKTLTYTAMMQQVELGRLDLDADVSRYLDFPINPGPTGVGTAPISLRQLATHTAGFEEELHDFGSDKSGKLPMDLRTFLIRNQPHRYARPGSALAYSNYGIALVGYIVQRASGEEFTSYVQRHIFEPLRMTHSSFVQPLPAAWNRSLGYLNTQAPDTGFEGFEEAPAGGLSSTAADMTRFGQMLLGGGTLDGVRVLQPASVTLFFTPQFSPAPLVASWNLGFYPETRNGYTFTGHGGDVIGFHSQFWVEPTHRLTFLVSYNSQRSGALARTELFQAFVDRYLPGPSPNPHLLKLKAKDLRPYTGSYASSRRADTTKTRLFLGAMSRSVTANKDGYLTISGATDLRGAPLHFQPVGNDTFYNDQGQSFLRFTRDARGRINGFVTPSHSDRLPPGLGVVFLGVTSLAAVLTMLLVVCATIFRTWQRLFQRRRLRPHPQPGTKWITLPLQVAMWASLAVLVDVGAILQHIAHYTSFWDIGHLERWFQVQNAIAALALALLVLGIWSGVRAFSLRLRWISRVKFAIVVLSCVWFAWIFVIFHFVGSATHY